MKQFLSFVYKEFCHILRDSRTVLILLVMPIVQIILFGFAISTDVNNVRLAVYDPSNDDATRQIVERFDANRYFSLVETLRTPQQIEEAFRSNRADLALVFEENFQQNLLHGGTGNVQLICDGTDPNTATLVTSYASNILAAYQAELSAGTPAPLQIVPEVKLLYNPQMKGAYNFVPGVMGMILMLICAMMTAISIVREKERGTMEVLLVSPMRPIYIILAKAVPYLALSAVNLATIILVAVYILQVPVAGSLFWLSVISLLFVITALALGLLISTLVSPMRPIYIILAKAVPYLALSAVNLATIILVAVYILQVPVAGSLFWLSVISLLFVITALALGLLISTLVKTQVAAMLASGMVLMMPTTLLSGMMFPIESMPGVLQGLSAVIPARWYIEAVKKVMIEGLGITYALKEVAILSAMAVVLVVVSLKKFKYRLE